MKQETEFSKQAQAPDSTPKLDLGFKEGQTITLNIGVLFIFIEFHSTSVVFRPFSKLYKYVSVKLKCIASHIFTARFKKASIILDIPSFMHRFCFLPSISYLAIEKEGQVSSTEFRRLWTPSASPWGQTGSTPFFQINKS